jgi:ferredoxin
MSHAMMTPQVFVINKSYNNIGCDDDDEEEEVDSDDMEYTEDAIDNMILELNITML